MLPNKGCLPLGQWSSNRQSSRPAAYCWLAGVGEFSVRVNVVGAPLQTVETHSRVREVPYLFEWTVHFGPVRSFTFYILT